MNFKVCGLFGSELPGHHSTGHLTPALLGQELRKFGRPSVPVYLYRMKPLHRAAIAEEIAGLSRPVEMLHQGRSYSFI